MGDPAVSGRTDLLGGVSPIMVASHIRAVTAAVPPTTRSRIQRERRAWIIAGVMLAVVLLAFLLALVLA